MPPGAPAHGDGDPSLNIPPEAPSPQEAITLLIAAMEHNSDDATFLQETSMPLLLQVSQEHWSEAIGSGAATLILDLLRRHAVNHEDLAEMCLFYLLGVQGHLMGEDPEGVNMNDTTIVRPVEWVQAIVLAMNSHKEHVGIQKFGATLLPSFTGDATATAMFVDAGAIPAMCLALTKLSGADGIQVQGGCSLAMAELLQYDGDGRAVDEVVKAGGLDMFIGILKRHGSASLSEGSVEAETLRFTCSSIGIMANRPSIISAFIKMDGMPIILSILKHQVSNPSVLQEVFKIMFSMRDNQEAIEAFLSAGGMRTLTDLLNENPGNAALTKGICLEFGSLIASSDDIADIVAAEGGLTALLQAMPHHDDEVEIPFLTCATMSACLGIENTVHVVESIEATPNVIQIVANVMQKHAYQEHLQSIATNLLASLTCSGSTMCHELVNSGGLQAIVDAMKRFSLNKELLGGAVCAIANVVKTGAIAMSSDDSTSKDISGDDMYESVVASGAVPILIIILLRDKVHDDAVVRNAIASLTCLARSRDDVKQQVASAGVEDRLFQLKSSRNDGTEDIQVPVQCLKESENDNATESDGVDEAS